MRKSSIVVAAAAFLITAAGAEARPTAPQTVTCNQLGCSDWASSPNYAPPRAKAAVRERAKATRQASRAVETPKASQEPRQGQIADSGPDPRPGAWCGWWLRRHLGVPKSAFPAYAYNLARAWLHVGSAAPHGCTGCVAVFSRGRGGHVGIVESWDASGNPVILSGNFNGRVDTAPHPASRLIGLRWVSGTAQASAEVDQFSATPQRHHHRIRYAARR